MDIILTRFHYGVTKSLLCYFPFPPVILPNYSKWLSPQKYQKNPNLTKKAIRVIAREKNLTHMRPLFAQLQILPYDLLVQLSKLSFMHSIKFNYAPESFTNVWLLNANREHKYQLRNNKEFVLPAPRIEFFRKQPIYTLPSEWNKLEDSRF